MRHPRPPGFHIKPNLPGWAFFVPAFSPPPSALRLRPLRPPARFSTLSAFGPVPSHPLFLPSSVPPVLCSSRPLFLPSSGSLAPSLQSVLRSFGPFLPSSGSLAPSLQSVLRSFCPFLPSSVPPSLRSGSPTAGTKQAERALRSSSRSLL